MKSIRLIFKHVIVFLLLSQLHGLTAVFSQVITVKQDGSGHFTTIQQAVDSASVGDTVLVWPGLYFENILIDQKAIALGSLALTTGDPAYADSTVIDGNFSGSCIYVYYCQDSVEINGFTLQHGSGESLGISKFGWGGGIFFFGSKGSASQCVISNNVVSGLGGGISVLDSDIVLTGNLIKDNQSFLSGGGVYVLGSVFFDSTYRNNIYLNYSANGCDIYFVSGYSPVPFHVCLDTFTVQNPDRYYLFSTDGSGVPNNDFTYSILHAKIEPSNSDLFVSPLGDNANSGLTPDDPLKTIAFALSSTVSDSLHPNTIHLANGTYAFNEGEKFPLNLRSHVSLIGEDRDSTILDASNVIQHVYGNILTSDYAIKNITFKNGNGDVNAVHQIGSFVFVKNHGLTLENLLFTENTGEVAACGTINVSDQATLKNVEFYHNHGGKALRVGMGIGISGLPNNKPDTVKVTDCIFRGNKPATDTLIAYGGGAAVLGSDVYDSSACIFTNCLFTGFRSEPTYDIGSIAFASHMGGEAYLVNCTFSDNRWNNLNNDGAPIAVTYGSWLHIYNSILYGDDPAEIYLYTTSGFENYLNIYHSLLENGMFGIKVYSPYNYIYYDPSNLNYYPQWDTTEPFPYSLLAGSPCIDAGTSELPPGITLPEYDLAGNPRIWGENVDMGAYEFGPWVGVAEKPGAKPPETEITAISATPNPFTHGTYIRFLAQQQGMTDISVYNAGGLKVRTLFHTACRPGDQAEIYWDCTDTRGTPLPAGSYLVRLSVEGKNRYTLKVVRSG